MTVEVFPLGVGQEGSMESVNFFPPPIPQLGNKPQLVDDFGF